MQIKVGNSYECGKGFIWQCVMINESEHDVREFLRTQFSDYIHNPLAIYAVSFGRDYMFLLVDHKRKCFDTCNQDGRIYNDHYLVKEVGDKIKKTFIMHKKSKNVYCVDENDYFCLYDDEDETRFTLWKTPKIDWRFYVKLDIAFEEYLELTGLKRKPKTLEIRKKLEESFGCQKELMTPILNKLEELIGEISKQKSCDGAIINFEKYVWSALHLLFQDKYEPSKNVDFNKSYRILQEYFEAKELENLQKTPQKVA